MAQRVGISVATLPRPTRCLFLNRSFQSFVWGYGPEFVAKDLRKWLAKTGAKTLYIEPGSPWENGYCESFNSKLRDEFLNGEIFYSITELRVLAEHWRIHYNTVRPHSSLGYRTTGPGSMADFNQQRAWRSGNRSVLPTSPHPRRRLSVNSDNCATLTPTGTNHRAVQDLPQ